MIVLALAASLVLAQVDLDAPPPPEDHLVPAFIPRSASLGVMINAPAVVPDIRIDWNADFYRSREHNFFGLLEIGAGVALALPKGMTQQYQYMAILGVGYRNLSRMIHWGFQFGVGAEWYRATFDNTLVPYGFENRIGGYAEGRLHASIEVMPHLAIGLYFGFGSLWSVDYTGRYPGSLYIGGFMPGVFLDWN